MFASDYVSTFSYIACGFIGFGMFTCQMIPLYGAVMMKSYPSRYISPIIIGLALIAVIVQGSMVEIFRAASTMLYLVYAVIMAVLAFVYTQIEPFLLFALRYRIADVDTDIAIGKKKDETPVAEVISTADGNEKNPFRILTAKEKEVAEFICHGYTNKDIAKALYISENTAKDHTKNIYRKIGVHSRIELATLVSNYRLEKKE
ncbi:MAG: helix-turn-helix transcriptional regulator [Clostridia bacterium]|nr:helix-turn-helix transcriptional regulator [Clostridia bacterium]